MVQHGRLPCFSGSLSISPFSLRKCELIWYLGLRHSCEIGDDMASYGWTEYDGRLGGKQIIKDRGMKLDLETEFIKVPASNGYTSSTLKKCVELIVGGNWAVRIKGRPQSQESVTNIFFYAGLEGFGELQLSTPFNSEVRLSGE